MTEGRFLPCSKRGRKKSERTAAFGFGRKSLAWSAHASQPAQIRLIKEGYVPKVLVITEGPIHWRSFNGVNQYDYYLISSPEFTVSSPWCKSGFGERKRLWDAQG